MATTTAIATSESCSSERLQQSPAPRTCSQQTAALPSFGRVSPAKCWLLGVLLLLTVAASWPTGTSAAPRKARGLHLILPQHHHHQHARSTPPELARQKKLTRLITNTTEGRPFCSNMNLENVQRIKELKSAREVANNTKKAIICLLNEYLEQNADNRSLEGQIKKYSYHDLALNHPLQAEVKKVQFDSHTQEFSYEGKVTNITKEMPVILESLLILQSLFDNIKYNYQQWHCFYFYLTEFFEHNIHEALNVTNTQESCNPRNAHYNNSTPDVAFLTAVETIKVLTIVEYKYDQLLNPSQSAGSSHVP
ncbi:uncharacterized protein LOC108044940 [Drosophila rhopaloa]|uniref:Uncharacterized protein LOC108044940 n=1 Tax=Drosophila rhopaloa TaxID=1041015 RepID=A0A6P4END2_DRORH|nr:uncharacterized protein LOC108044940 [Drosophila rhopaloa]